MVIDHINCFAVQRQTLVDKIQIRVIPGAISAVVARIDFLPPRNKRHLYMDFREQRGRTPGIYADTQLNFAICHQTEGDYKAADRYVNVFKPVLYPIYYSLMKQLTKSPLTVQGDQDMLQHDKWDRMFWGTSKVVGGGGTDRSYLNDFVDAIEIQNLALKINYQPCVTPAYPQAAGS